MAKVSRMIRDVLMPRSCAVSRLSAVARIAMPSRLRATKTCSVTMRTRATPRIRSWTEVTVTGPRRSVIGSRRCGKPTSSLPKRRVATSCSTMPTPMVLIMGARRCPPRARIGRNATSSISTPRSGGADEPAHQRGDHAGARPQHDEQPDERADHEHLAVRQMHEVQHPEHERVADRDEGVGAPQHHAVDELLEEHMRSTAPARTCPSSPPARTARARRRRRR